MPSALDLPGPSRRIRVEPLRTAPPAPSPPPAPPREEPAQPRPEPAPEPVGA